MTTAHGELQRSEISASALGMILFISSEIMFFAALFGAYFTIRSRVWILLFATLYLPR